MTVPTESNGTGSPLTFGKNYAILNLDFMNILFDIAKSAPKGQQFVSNCTHWIEAVHKKDVRPLNIFTTLYFSTPSQAELPTGAPFTKLVNNFAQFDEHSPIVKVPSYLNVDEKDIVLQKIRWYGGAGNDLEGLLKRNDIDTVVISGLSLSGAVMSTIYRLFDLDYTVYVISDNVLELPVPHHEQYSAVLLGSLMGKMNLPVITLEEALQALEQLLGNTSATAAATAATAATDLFSSGTAKVPQSTIISLSFSVNMKSTRYANSRQKACQQCSVAKAKCDRRERCCSRCAQRGLSCVYVNTTGGSVPFTSFARSSGGPLLSPERDDVSTSTQGTPQDPLTPPIHPALASNSSIVEFSPTIPAAAPTRLQLPVAQSSSPLFPAPTLQPDILEFSNLDLVCPINAEEISNRWLNAYIPIPGQSVKNYPPTVSAFIYRILKSYTGMAIHGRGFPPFVHGSQLTGLSQPLSTCLSIIRICDRPLPGSENVTAEILQREMNSLYEQRETFDDLSLLSSFQAFLMYTMVLFFKLSQGTSPFLRQAMMNLQELACVTSRCGLVCLSEQQRTRPKWESWIIAEAKRRTLYTMYLFDSVLSSEDGLPTFLGTELEGLPSAASRDLWAAQTRREWEATYNMHLADWVEGSLCIEELWPIPEGLSEPLIARRRHRVDNWLENLDEFGIMLYTVTSCTHGG